MPGNNSSDQSRRFEQAAREAGCDETGEAFEHAFGKIVPPKLPDVTKPGGEHDPKPPRAH